jgi:Ca2+-binding EF-hand superfamily protein
MDASANIIIRRVHLIEMAERKMIRTVADLSEEEQAELIETFSLVDVNHDESLSGKEILQALKALPQDEKDEEVFQLIREIEKDTSGHVTREEYMDHMANELTQAVTRAEVELVFRMFDVESVGAITISALRQVADELGDNLSDTEIKAMLKGVDRDGDGKVTLDEFYRLITRH